MMAVLMRRFGGPEVLEVANVPVPRPELGEILVRVDAVSIGRLLDLALRSGQHPYARCSLPHILGAEHAGVVAALGVGVHGFAVGDRVASFPAVSCGHCHWCLAGRTEACPELELIGVQRQGAYAEYSCVPARTLYRLPPDVSTEDAAAVVLSGAVAWRQLHEAGVVRGTWVLVQGASSALGSTTATLARFQGARVIAASRSAWKRERLTELGFDAVIDPFSADLLRTVEALTEGRGVDVVVDDIGDPSLWESSISCLGPCGTVVTSGAFAGGKVTVDLLRLYSRNQRIIGVRTGNPASVFGLWSAVADGFRPVVDRTFPLEDASDAHAYMERGDSLGRVLLVNKG